MLVSFVTKIVINQLINSISFHSFNTRFWTKSCRLESFDCDWSGSPVGTKLFLCLTQIHGCTGLMYCQEIFDKQFYNF